MNYPKSNAKCLLIASSMLAFSSTVTAETWYDDWDLEITPIYQTTNVYSGIASCNGLSTFIPTSSYSTVYLYEDFFGGVGWNYNYPNAAAETTCRADVPFEGSITSQVDEIRNYYPIMPYPESVDIERLGCDGTQRNVIVKITDLPSNVSNMKIFAAYSPSYALTQYYSGPAAAGKMVKVNANSSTVNFRVKLDNGSSYYTAAHSMKCGGGSIPVPLD